MWALEGETGIRELRAVTEGEESRLGISYIPLGKVTAPEVTTVK